MLLKCLKLVALWLVVFGGAAATRRIVISRASAQRPRGQARHALTVGSSERVNFEDLEVTDPLLAHEMSDGLEIVRVLARPCGSLAMRDTHSHGVKYKVVIYLAEVADRAEVKVDHVEVADADPPLSAITRRCLEEELSRIGTFKVSSLPPQTIVYSMCFTPQFQSGGVGPQSP